MEKKSKYNGRMGMQYKELPIDTKDVSYNSDSRIISGYAAVFGNKDKADDILIKGCFSKSIQERGPESSANDKIIMLWMHDMSEPIGRITELREDDKGLYFEAAIDDIDLGDRVIKQLESGTLNQFSIGYGYVWENCEFDNEREALIVREVKLYEISVVSIGCNGETEYLGLKSQEDVDKAYRELDTEIADFCTHMGAVKQQKLQKIVSKAMSLAAARPGAHLSTTPEVKQADCNDDENKSMLNFFKLKK